MGRVVAVDREDVLRGVGRRQSSVVVGDEDVVADPALAASTPSPVTAPSTSSALTALEGAERHDDFACAPAGAPGSTQTALPPAPTDPAGPTGATQAPRDLVALDGRELIPPAGPTASERHEDPERAPTRPRAIPSVALTAAAATAPATRSEVQK